MSEDQEQEHAQQKPKDRKGIWTPQGSLKTPAKGQTLEQQISKISAAFAHPNFQTSVPAQSEAIRFIQQYSEVGGTPVAHLAARMRKFLAPQMTEHRFDVILGMKNPADIEKALERTYIEPRPFATAEGLYPTEGWLGEYLKHAREGNAPIGYHFWIGASILGAACRRNLYLNLGYDLFPNFYLFLIGDTGLGKSEAFDTGLPVLQHANATLIPAILNGYHVSSDDVFPDRRVKEIPKDTSPEWALYTMRPHGRISPPSGETMLVLNDTDSVAYFANDELITMFDKSKHGAAGLLHIVTDLYNCQDRGKGTHARGGEQLRNVALTFLVGSTLEWINDSVTESMFGGGFMGRCLFCTREKPDFEYRKNPPPRDPIAVHRLGEALHPWMMMRSSQVRMTEGAERVWDDLLERRQRFFLESMDERMKTYWRRKQNHIAQVAMVLVASKHTESDLHFNLSERTAHLERRQFYIDEETMRWAVDIVEHEEQYLPELFRNIGEHKDSIHMERAVAWLTQQNKATGKPVTIGKWMVVLAKRWHRQAPQVHESMMRMEMVRARRYQPKRGKQTQVVWDPKQLGEAPPFEPHELENKK